MRTRLLALVLLGVVLSGCGGDPGPEQAGDPPSSPTASSPADPTPTSPGTPGSNPAGDIGAAFRAFARGGDPPPTADRVDLYLGNAFTGEVEPGRVGHRGAWATCTETGSYAGASCPVSPLDVLRQHPDAVAARPRGRCLATYGSLPPDLRKLDRTVLVPKRATSCADDFAIQLVTDDRGRLVAVSTLLGEP